MDFIYTALRFFQNGGAFMYPIAVVLVIGLVIAIERWAVLSRARSANRRAFNDILPLLRRKDYKGAIGYGEGSNIPVARIVAAGLVRMSSARRREDIEYAMEEGVLETLPRLEKRTGYLAMLANISTLLGLLGTIIGLIAAFTAVAEADPTDKAKLLSQSISLAMNTTAFGLIAAIPLLILHSLLVSKTTEIVDSLEMVGVKCINLLFNPQDIEKTQQKKATKVDVPSNRDRA